MEIVITASPAAVATIAADAIERLVNNNPEPALGLATGSSPLPTYQLLIERHRTGVLSFSRCSAFLLDEYVGLDPGHPEAYRTFIQRKFIDHIDLPHDALYGPDGTTQDRTTQDSTTQDSTTQDSTTPDLATAADHYEQLITAAGGIDLQLLGIGSDGHIGFNEPTSSLGSRTRLKTLTDATRADNARFFDGDINAVPRHVLTQGIGTILEARHLVLIATGESKAVPVAKAVEGPLTAMVPASALQLHPHVTVIVDEAAAQRLSQAEYYRQAFKNKPAWQTI